MVNFGAELINHNRKKNKMRRTAYLNKASEIAQEAGGELRTERSKLAANPGKDEKEKILERIAELESDWQPKAELETLAHQAAVAGLTDADLKALTKLID
jgi:hypothetical protein